MAQRAVVLGASFAGLLAARVLSAHFADVVLFERDAWPDQAAPRKGTPQAVHPHGLLARGREVLEQLFPGFTDAMVARCGLAGDQAAATLQALRERAADIASPELVKITHEGKLIGDLIRDLMPHSQRRHHE